jgi:hypothetical protein
LELLSIATITAGIKKNRPDAASQSQADRRRPQRCRAQPLDVFARSITFKVEQPRSPALAF